MRTFTIAVSDQGEVQWQGSMSTQEAREILNLAIQQELMQAGIDIAKQEMKDKMRKFFKEQRAK